MGEYAGKGLAGTALGYGIANNNQINNEIIEPNLLNKVANKCNDLIDKIDDLLSEVNYLLDY